MRSLVSALFLIVGVVFASPFKDLIQEMQAMHALTVRMYEEDLIKNFDYTKLQECKDPYFYREAMERHAALFFSLSLDFMGKIPLFQTLQPKTPQDREFLRVLKAYESLQLFAILHSYILFDAACSVDVSPLPAFDATQVTQDFLDLLNLFFAPIFQAHKQGSSLWDTLKNHTQDVGGYDFSKAILDIEDTLDHMPGRQKTDPVIKPLRLIFNSYCKYCYCERYFSCALGIADYEKEAYDKFIKKFLSVDLQQKPATLLDAYYASRFKVLLQNIQGGF